MLFSAFEEFFQGLDDLGDVGTCDFRQPYFLGVYHDVGSGIADAEATGFRDPYDGFPAFFAYDVFEGVFEFRIAVAAAGFPAVGAGFVADEEMGFVARCFLFHSVRLL